MLSGEGNGPIDAAVHALRGAGIAVQVRSYEERSIGDRHAGAGAQACAFVELAQSAILHRDPARFAKLLGQLFDAMATGGDFGVDEVRRFNGGLFNDDAALPLDPRTLVTEGVNRPGTAIQFNAWYVMDFHSLS